MFLIMSWWPSKQLRGGADDFESAFTSLPFNSKDSKYNMCHVRNPKTGKVNFFQHAAGFFGGAGVLLAWTRSVRPLMWTLCSFLGVMAVIHVDDIVWGDIAELAHSTAFCIRVVAKIFGFKLKASKRRGPATMLEALGGLMTLPSINVWSWTVTLKPSKREKYIKRFQAIVHSRQLSSAYACKLAGAMQWSQSLMFGRVG